jgi:predicted dehydrogenase
VHTLAALSHDCHVLCEKPMASTEEECRRMNALARERGRVLAIGMIRRFFPAYAGLRNLLAEGSLGRIESFEFREGRRFDWDVTTSAAFRPRAQGGTGVLFDIGPHVLDALSWMLGELRVVHYSDDALGGVESNATLDVAAARCEGTVHLSWDSPQSNELRVCGDRGEAVLRSDRFDRLAVKRQAGFEPCSIASSFAADLLPLPRRRISPRSYADAIYCQIVQVLRALTLEERPAADGADGQNCVSLLESALSMAGPLPMPWLDEADQRAYEELHWSNAP